MYRADRWRGNSAMYRADRYVCGVVLFQSRTYLWKILHPRIILKILCIYVALNDGMRGK